MCACHPCAGAVLIFSASFQFERMMPEGNPRYEEKTWSAKCVSRLRVAGVLPDEVSQHPPGVRGLPGLECVCVCMCFVNIIFTIIVTIIIIIIIIVILIIMIIISSSSIIIISSSSSSSIIEFVAYSLLFFVCLLVCLFFVVRPRRASCPASGRRPRCRVQPVICVDLSLSLYIYIYICNYTCMYVFV